MQLILVIIHAVGDLIVSPRQSYKLWRINPLEFIIFFAAVVVSIFTTLEGGIYTAVGASLVVLLYRICRPAGEFLGRLRISAYEGASGLSSTIRYIWIPIRRKNLNPGIFVQDPPPGIIVYRFEESFLFPNASYMNDRIASYAKEKTRRGKSTQYKTLGDRPWNEGFVPRSMTKYFASVDADTRPLLRAVVLDFSAVANVDSTSIQALIDTRQQLEKYADRQIEFHFAAVLSPWVRRGLVAGGFGVGNPTHRIIEVAPINAINLSAGDPNLHGDEEFQRRRRREGKDPEAQEITEIPDYSNGKDREEGEVLPVAPTNYPFFHIDVDDAVKAAEKAYQ